MHDAGPVRYITRYDDVVATIRDHGGFSSDVMAGPPGREERMIISTDPPDHTAMRRLVTKPFRPSAIAALEPRVRQVADELVDELLAANRRGEADLIDQLGAPLPVVVIAEMLGIPGERREEFRRWSDDAISGMGGMLGQSGGGSGGGAGKMGAFFTEIVAERRADPGDDLISLLIGGAEPLSERELVMFCILLLIAGNETTTNLVGNAATALMAHPDQAERLWAEPALVPSAVEEVLRFDPPAQLVIRRATADATIAGEAIPEDGVVMLGLASANRDPRRVEEPDRFDVARNPADHVAFGNGVHLCLGAALARLEAKVVLEVLIERVANLRPAGVGRRRSNPLLRGFHSLPVAFDEVS